MPLFGGHHRHGINYSTSTTRKAPDRAKITQEKIAPEPASTSDISPPPDTRNGESKQNEASGRSDSRQDERMR